MGKHSRLLAAAAALALAAGCGDTSEDGGEQAAPVLTAATLGEQQLLSAAEHLSRAPYAEADQSNGARQAQVCRACHSLEAGGVNMIGPALHGFFGTKAGSHEGFEYSRVLAEANFVWTPRALDAWLVQPGRFLPGNRMSFGGVRDDQKRADLVAYLLTVTSEPQE